MFAARGRAGRSQLVCTRRSISTQHRPCSRTSNCRAPYETPERVFPGVQIDVIWFPEGAGGDRCYLRETVIKHPDRAEATRVWNFPYSAIEEALVNAVYHRSYEEREPIEVRISNDELVVVSCPGPDLSI